MATKTLSLTNADYILHYEKLGTARMISATVDFTNAAVTCAQNDIVEALAIPANTFVYGIRAEVLTVEGAARNFAIGDGADTDGYITTQSANTLAEFHSLLTLTEATPNTITGYSNGKYYAAADTIDILAVTSGGLTTCKLKVSAYIVDYN